MGVETQFQYQEGERCFLFGSKCEGASGFELEKGLRLIQYS